MAFVSLLHLFSPEAIFVGGGVSINLGERILGPARQEIANRALPGYRNVPLIVTNLGDNIGLLNGNQAHIPVHIPINVCGNSIAVLGLANSNAGCVND